MPRTAYRSGFTLIELLVVITIISMLAGMLMPVYSKAREKGRQIVCYSNQHQINLALQMYAQDYDERLPRASNVWTVLQSDRAMLPAVFRCPDQSFRQSVGFVFNNALSEESLGAMPDPSRTLTTIDGAHVATANPMTYDNVLYSGDDILLRHSGHAVCSFLDGHIGLDSDMYGFEYDSDFTNAIGSEWTPPTEGVTPHGQRFLGRFARDEATLSLTMLPRHKTIDESFDLYVIGTWDGNSSAFGPDTWSLRVGDTGQKLLVTTFDNANDDPAGNPQSYPGAYPADSNPARTGATANNSLGFQYNNGGVTGIYDAIYHLEENFSHTATSLSLIFSGKDLNSDGINDDAWGLANVKVRGD